MTKSARQHRTRKTFPSVVCVLTLPFLLLSTLDAAAAFHLKSLTDSNQRYHSKQRVLPQLFHNQEHPEPDTYLPLLSTTLPPPSDSAMETNIMDRIFVSLHKGLWSILTRIGTRNIISVIRLLPWYRDTIFYFDTKSNSTSHEKLIVLTIDDGLSRGGSGTSVVPEVLSMLKRYNAHATFFVCSNYCTIDEGTRQATQDLVLKHGHEIGNHMSEDKSGYYSQLDEERFASEFEDASQALHELIAENNDASQDTTHSSLHGIRWFRAPQGVYTPSMRRVISSHRVSHVLGDVYSDDWALACKDATFVCNNMLRQVREGSVVISHMPEKGTDREAILDVMERFLKEITTRGYRVVSLSEMMDFCCNRHAHS